MPEEGKGVTLGYCEMTGEPGKKNSEGTERSSATLKVMESLNLQGAGTDGRDS